MRKTEIEEKNMTDINKIENGPMRIYLKEMDLQTHFPQYIYYRVFTILIWIVAFL